MQTSGNARVTASRQCCNLQSLNITSCALLPSHHRQGTAAATATAWAGTGICALHCLTAMVATAVSAEGSKQQASVAVLQSDPVRCAGDGCQSQVSCWPGRNGKCWCALGMQLAFCHSNSHAMAAMCATDYCPCKVGLQCSTLTVARCRVSVMCSLFTEQGGLLSVIQLS